MTHAPLGQSKVLDTANPPAKPARQKPHGAYDSSLAGQAMLEQ
jgi:hypothetical protein